MFKRLKFIFLFLLTATLLLPSSPAFAREHGGGGGGRPGPGRGDFHGDDFHVAHRLPPGYVSLMAGSLALLYCEGLFYRYTPAGYAVVTPPMGAVVPALPPGYTMVVANGTPYYYYGYTYYAPAPGGYAVVGPPAVTAFPAPIPTTTVVAPVTQTVMAAAPVMQQPVAVASTAPIRPALYPSKEEELNRDVYEIYIPNGNGSFTQVTLRKTEKGFLGPQGEFYEDHPTIDQLRERYAKK
ncbi:MAG: DUF6515 family protein [Candidatus Omnitrophota bacterium]